MKYKYTQHAIRDGEHWIETKTVSSEQLYREMGRVGEGAFMMLINKWNRIGLLGVPNGGPVYVYVIDEVE